MSGVGSIGSNQSDDGLLICSLMSAPDLKKDFTWSEIDGVYRVVQIDFTSAIVDAQSGSTVVFTRQFVYEVSDPYNLDYIQESLSVT